MEREAGGSVRTDRGAGGRPPLHARRTYTALRRRYGRRRLLAGQSDRPWHRDPPGQVRRERRAPAPHGQRVEPARTDPLRGRHQPRAGLQRAGPRRLPGFAVDRERHLRRSQLALLAHVHGGRRRAGAVAPDGLEGAAPRGVLRSAGHAAAAGIRAPASHARQSLHDADLRRGARRVHRGDQQRERPRAGLWQRRPRPAAGSLRGRTARALEPLVDQPVPQE